MVLVGWGSLLAQIHETSQQPIELQMKDEVLELPIETENNQKGNKTQENLNKDTQIDVKDKKK